MTLSVSAHFIDANGELHDLPVDSDLAGFEASRRSFYGSPMSSALGLQLLPKLKDQSELFVQGAELVSLASEIETLKTSLPTGAEWDYWRFRLDNITMAVKLAQAHGIFGAVCIG